MEVVNESALMVTGPNAKTQSSFQYFCSLKVKWVTFASISLTSHVTEASTLRDPLGY